MRLMHDTRGTVRACVLIISPPPDTPPGWCCMAMAGLLARGSPRRPAFPIRLADQWHAGWRSPLTVAGAAPELRNASFETIRAPVSLFSRLAPGTITILLAEPVAPAKGWLQTKTAYPEDCSSSGTASSG